MEDAVSLRRSPHLRLCALPLLLAAALASGCSLLAPVALCGDDAECPDDEVCGGQSICVVPEVRDDAGPARPAEDPFADDENEPEMPPAEKGDAGLLDEGRSDAGDAGAADPVPPGDAGFDAEGRPFGTAPPGVSSPPPGPQPDGGTDGNGRCIEDWACPGGEVCDEGVCVSS